jgi:hypothetical protein
MSSTAKSMMTAVISKWKQDKVIFNKPATEGALEDCEKRLRLAMPESVKSFYRICNGTTPVNDFRLRLWKLDEVASWNDENPSSCVVFMDYGVINPTFGFSINRNDQQAIFMFDKKIAYSFDDFLKKYLQDPLSLSIDESVDIA